MFNYADKNVLQEFAAKLTEKYLKKFVSSPQPRILRLNKIVNSEAESKWNFVLEQSFDGIHFGEVMKLPDDIYVSNVLTAVNLCKAGEFWYILTSGNAWASKDFINWSNIGGFITLSGNGKDRYGAPFLYEQDGNIYVVFFYCSDKSKTVKDVRGADTNYFVIKKTAVSQNTGTGKISAINAQSCTTIIGDGNTNSYIDPAVVEHNGSMYMTIKDEINCKIQLYTIDGDDVHLTAFNHRGAGIEACKPISTDSGLYIYAEPFALTCSFDNPIKYIYPKTTSIRIKAIDEFGNYNRDAKLQTVKAPFMDHPAFCKCDKYLAKYIDENFDVSLYTDEIFKSNAMGRYYIIGHRDSGNDVIQIMNHPYYVSVIGDEDDSNLEANSRIILKYETIFEDVDSVKIMNNGSKNRTNTRIFYPAYGVNNVTDHTYDSTGRADRRFYLDYGMVYKMPVFKGANGVDLIMFPYVDDSLFTLSSKHTITHQSCRRTSEGLISITAEITLTSDVASDEDYIATVEAGFTKNYRVGYALQFPSCVKVGNSINVVRLILSTGGNFQSRETLPAGSVVYITLTYSLPTV